MVDVGGFSDFLKYIVNPMPIIQKVGYAIVKKVINAWESIPYHIRIGIVLFIVYLHLLLHQVLARFIAWVR